MNKKEDVYSSLGPQRKKFMGWQARTILVSMLGYAMFYFVRKKRALAGSCFAALWSMARLDLSMATSLTV